MLPLQFAFKPNLRKYIREFFHSAYELYNAVKKPSYQFIPDDVEDDDKISHIFCSLWGSSIALYLFGIATFFALSLCIVGYSWYIAVNFTTMANLTAIYNTSCFWAYVFSILILGESVRVHKIGAVCLSIAGIIVLTFFKEGNNIDNNTTSGHAFFLGDLITTFSAILCGLNEVLYKRYVSPPTPSILFSNTLTGLMGLITLSLFWVPLPILHFTGIEEFELPNLYTLGYIFLIALTGLVFNASFLIVISFTSPLFAAIGIMLTVPLVALVDVGVTGVPLEVNTMIGGLFILLGFVILSWSWYHEVNKKNSNFYWIHFFSFFIIIVI